MTAAIQFYQAMGFAPTTPGPALSGARPLFFDGTL